MSCNADDNDALWNVSPPMPLTQVHPWSCQCPLALTHDRSCNNHTVSTHQSHELPQSCKTPNAHDSCHNACQQQSAHKNHNATKHEACMVQQTLPQDHPHASSIVTTSAPSTTHDVRCFVASWFLCRRIRLSCSILTAAPRNTLRIGPATSQHNHSLHSGWLLVSVPAARCCSCSSDFTHSLAMLVRSFVRRHYWMH